MLLPVRKKGKRESLLAYAAREESRNGKVGE